MFYNQTIQDVENELIAYRARNLLKQPVHPGETMAQYRARKAMQRHVIVVALCTLAAVGLLVTMRVF